MERKNGNDEGQNCGPSCCCGSPSGTLPRRDFMKAVGLGAAAMALSRLPAMAGPFEASDFANLIPADKKLDPEWVKSLFARGLPEVYCDSDLARIGMPVGGICAGQVYLGGDGKLWHWDIFNKHTGTGAEHYAKPMSPSFPLEQSFEVRLLTEGRAETRALDRSGFPNIRFCGEYPIGIVDYEDPDWPLKATLEAFSPFIPLDAENSSLPATVMRFTLKNKGSERLDVELSGRLENAVCLHNRSRLGERTNAILREPDGTILSCTALGAAATARARPDVVFEDWKKAKYEGWTAEGQAFGSGPLLKSAIPSYQADVGGEGDRVVNSHAAAPGDGVEAKDAQIGKLTSRPFTIERNFIRVWIGGGADKDKTCLHLVVDGKAVVTLAGRNDNRMSLQDADVRAYAGKQGMIEIVDVGAGDWGNIGVGKITFTDRPLAEGDLCSLPDFGSMALALIGAPAERAEPQADAKQPSGKPGDAASAPLSETLIGVLGRRISLPPGHSETVSFVVAWHFPNLVLKDGGRHYATRFDSAAAVARYVGANYESLHRQTRLWHDTWYESTLPYWFLDRTLANASILASSTCHWFKSGRFYGWEGVGCCEGTCTHVWHYAHSVARLFPQLERDLRERTDFGLAFDEKTGIVRMRGEAMGLAVDGQAGVILRSYREHLMSANDAFLRRNWPRIKAALECLMRKDSDGDCLLDGAQHNTLDADWYGPVAWLSGLFLAALRAGEEMATELGEEAFAGRCRGLLATGRATLLARLFNGEYFVNVPDPSKPETINSGTGCEIDQVMGQSWAFQVGLGRVLPEKETRTALGSLWRYNYAPDVGPYRAVNKPGRWYAMAGEAGLLMCTFPRPDWDYSKAKGKGADWAAGYFNECMNGFEYQVAGHMIWEGMVLEGLAIARSVHDRYDASKRNPWNEVECGDHYARSMASHGVYLAACGFEYHGPRGRIGFAPRLTPEKFQAAFTAAEGWGTYRQEDSGSRQSAELELRWGKLRLCEVVLTSAQPREHVKATLDDAKLAATVTTKDGRTIVSLETPLQMAAGQVLRIALS